MVAVAPQLERNFADGSTLALVSLSPLAVLLSFSLSAYATVTSTLSISPKADANEHMEVTWKYDVKSVGGGAYSSPPQKSHGGHVDLTGEREGDIYPASQLVTQPIRLLEKKNYIVARTSSNSISWIKITNKTNR